MESNRNDEDGSLIECKRGRLVGLWSRLALDGVERVHIV